MKNLKKAISLLLVALLMLSTATFAADEVGTTIYVSPVGSDFGDGSINNPYATLKAAKEAVAGYSGATVIFKGGKYYFNEKITFTSKDSGVTYKAQEGANVVFTGAVNIDKNLFKKVTDTSILKRLPESSRSKVFKLELEKQGIEITDVYPALYVNNNQAIIARYPNEGYIKAENASGTTRFDIAYPNAANWTGEDITLIGSLEREFRWSETKVTNVSGTTVTLKNGIRKNAYFYVRNLLEELDVPGEYIIENNVLYYYPTDDLSNLSMEIVTYSDSSMIEINGADNLTFDGIIFEKSNSSAINYGESNIWTSEIKIKNCNFKYIIKKVLDIRGYDHIISDNYAYGCGGSFIEFRGGAKENLTSGNILVTRNRIVACGNWNPYAEMIKGGINSWEDRICIGNTITNNIIQDCITFSAIGVTGNNNTIKYNEIINQGRIIEDGGAIYSGKSATKYGTVVSHNYIHDFALNNDYTALYSDDGMSGLTMEHNVIARVASAMKSGLGANNNFNHNLLIDVGSGITLGTRMVGWGVDFSKGGTLYQEALGIVENLNPAIRDTYNREYPKIKEMVDNHINRGYPFFAPWNTLVKGNVLISDNESLTTIASKPSHKYTTTSFGSTCNVEGEDKLGTLLKTYYSGYTKYVDEIATYGDKEANDAGINATELGNPKFSHSAVKLTGDMVTSKLSDVSDVHNIELDSIGIISSTNDDVLNKNPETVKFGAVSVDSNKAVITWETVEKASEYDIIISKNADLSSPVVNEKCYNIFFTNNYTFNHNGESGTYYYKVIAHGLSREDGFTVSATGSFTVEEVNKDNLKNALEIAKGLVTSANAGSVSVTDLNSLKSGCQINDAILNSDTSSQVEVDTAEEALYALIEAANVTPASEMKIIRVEPEQNSTLVCVEAIGFPANSLATVMVTNPQVALSDVASDFSMNNIRYVSTVIADETGKISTSFDTSRNEIDYTGVYDIYIKNNAEDTAIKGSYNYGTVELSDVEFKTLTGETIAEIELENYKGKEIKLSTLVKNRLSRTLTPEAYLGIYEAGSLKNTFIQNQTAINANSYGVVEIAVTIPESFTNETKFKLFMWDSGKMLRPLTKTRFIFK